MSRSDLTQATLDDEGGAEVAAPVALARYEIGSLLGRGGVGQVHRAVDRLSGDTVAVKFVRIQPGFATSQVRQELTALRGLEMPGVCTLLDDGVDGGQFFLVTRLVDGPELGSWLRLRPSWDEVGPAFRTLLVTLTRLHWMGIYHRDLKPGNVRVDASGHPVLLDFGLAGGARVAPAENAIAGTLRYAPPEQWEGHPGDERTDRYALGVMLREWLEKVAVDPPGHLMGLANTLCEPDIDQRPGDPIAVLEAMGGEASALWGSAPSDVERTPEGLRVLFGGPRISFRHVDEDLAEALHTQAGGGEIEPVLKRWVAAGHVYWNGEHFVPCGPLRSPTRVRPEAGSEALDEACELATELARDGQHRLALECLERQERDLRGRPEYAGMLELYGRVVLELQSLRWISLAQQRVECALGEHPRLSTLRGLLAGATAASRGEPERAEALLRAPLEDEDLELLRQGYLNYAARARGREHHVRYLGGLDRWAAASQRRRGALAGWRAQLAYSEGRWRDAAEGHERSAGLRTAAVWRMAARVSAAQAWLDVPDFGRARALGEQVRASARQLRHAAFEARATWVGRAARYRSGEDLKADPAWVDAAEEVDDAMFAVMAINEAAIAWRAGDGLAGSLARRALAAFGRRTNADGVLLARALLRGLEGGDHPGDEALAAEAMRATVPEVGLQALALIPHPEPGRWRARGIELAASRPAEAWSVCLDVMSIDEALERLGS